MICAYDVFVRAGRAVRFASEVAGAAGAISLSRRQEILAANASVLAQFRAAQDLPFHRPPRSALSDNAALRDLARLLHFEAVVLADGGDFPGAVGALTDGIVLAALTQSGGTIALLASQAMDALSRSVLWRWRGRLEAPAAQAAARRLAAVSARRPAAVQLFAAEKRQDLALWQDRARRMSEREMERGIREAFGIRGMTKSRWLAYLTRYHDRRIAFARAPYRPTAGPFDPALDLFPAGHYVVLALDLAMKDALLIAALALQAFRSARGDYPDTLERLAEDGILARVPRDPFSGKPLRYGRIDATRYVLYSVGPDARDEGGEPMVAGAADRRGDFVVGVNTD